MNFLTISIFVRIPFIKIPTRYYFTLPMRRIVCSIKYNTNPSLVLKDFFKKCNQSLSLILIYC